MIKYVEIENAGGKRGYVFKADFEPKVGDMVYLNAGDPNKVKIVKVFEDGEINHQTMPITIKKCNQ